MTKRKKRERDEYDDLYEAVARYVEKKGGKVLVAGGVQVGQIPGDDFRFTIAVKCTGRAPAFTPDQQSGAQHEP